MVSCLLLLLIYKIMRKMQVKMVGLSVERMSCITRKPAFVGFFLPGLTQTGLYSHRRARGLKVRI